jgi:hypothetical protein
MSPKRYQQNQIFSLINSDRSKSIGQSMVELALLFPVLLILLSGLVEFGFILNEYLSVMDAARNAARFASDGVYFQYDDVSTTIDNMRRYHCICEGCAGYIDINGNWVNEEVNPTNHFYRQIACLVNQELRQEVPTIDLNENGTESNEDDYLDPLEGNDMIISVFSFTEGEGITSRYPDNDGWSYSQDLNAETGKVSRFTSEEINNRLVSLTSPDTGYVLVEIFYYYDQLLKLPWITAVVEDPLLLHTYAFMPLSSAEPTPYP